MDTAAYLTSQGWRGDGHALHHTGRGITKPILVSKKANVLGIGKKKHDAHADQWWARAFDETLKGLNTTKDEATGKTEGLALGAGAQALQMAGSGGAKWVGSGGLYGNFVKGESLSGTLTPDREGHEQPMLNSSDQRDRKRDDHDEERPRPAHEEKKKSKKQRPRERVTEDFRQTDRYFIEGDQDRVKEGDDDSRWQRKLERKQRKEQRRQKKTQQKARKLLDSAQDDGISLIKTKKKKKQKKKEELGHDTMRAG